MRSYAALVFAAALMSAPLAWPDEPVAAAEAVEDAQMLAARDALHALMFDTGILDASLNEGIATRLPEFRAGLQSDEVQRRLSPRAQSALETFISEMPDFMRTEISNGANELIYAIANRAASLLTAEEWSAFAAFMRQAEGRSLMLKLSQGRRSEVTQAEMDAVMRFYATPAGAAYARNGAAINEIMENVLATHGRVILDRMSQRSYQRACELLADECPPAIRSAATPR